MIEVAYVCQLLWNENLTFTFSIGAMHLGNVPHAL